jgi:hypothetical protein
MFVLFNLKSHFMIDFDLKTLVPYLEEKGWQTSYSLDARAYWNCTWETPTELYVIEVPVWPFTKVTFLKHKVRGYVVDKTTGEIFTMPNFEFDLKMEAYMTYHYLRIWISALMERK